MHVYGRSAPGLAEGGSYTDGKSEFRRSVANICNARSSTSAVKNVIHNHCDTHFFLQRTMMEYGNIWAVEVQSEGVTVHLVLISCATMDSIQSNQGCQIGGPLEGRRIAFGGHRHPNAHERPATMSLFSAVWKLCNVSGVCALKNKISLEIPSRTIISFRGGICRRTTCREASVFSLH